MRTPGTVAALLLVTHAAAALAEGPSPPPVSAFARAEAIADAAISPDGHYLALLRSVDGVNVAFVLDRTAANSRLSPVVAGAKDHRFNIGWCQWATNTRLLCGISAMVATPETVYETTRLAAVDADGRNLKTLVESEYTNSDVGQFQDQIINWNPGTPDTVLIEAQANLLDYRSRALGSSEISGQTVNEYPSIFELNVVTGQMHELVKARPPLRHFVTDAHGEARLGWGIVGDTNEIRYDVRDPQAHGWRLLERYKYFGNQDVKRPIAICSDNPNCAYALGAFEGRQALWRMDLTGKAASVVEFSHPAFDVGGPQFANDGTLVGVEYETDRPFLYYTDPQFDSIVRGARTLLPDRFVVILDATRDRRVFLLRTTSDIDGGTYYVFDTARNALSRLGTAYPELDGKPLGRMQTISYPAADGTTIPGYLTVPPGLRAEHLPLVVMPHGGPIARDSWEFDFLRAFLVSRGYAVLQMNFRGSSGYGGAWFYAAHQDWGGLTYSDIVDGARWAVHQGIADPARVCIVGWSFGGYAALLGAVRNGDLFRCAVSIAGISDLSLLVTEDSYYTNSGVSREQIGRDPTKLRADSPRRHAQDVHIPVLMFHGDKDAQVNVEQSRAMDAALTHAGKPHQFIFIEGADHQMSRVSDRTRLLEEVERFLSEHIGPGAAPTP